MDEVRAVRDDIREAAALKERLVETEIEHERKARVDVDADEVRVPLQRVRVETLRKRLAPVGPPAERLADAVQPREGSPVERAADVVDAPVRGYGMSIAAAGIFST